MFGQGTSMRVLIFGLSLCYLNVAGMDLPSYIPKCSLSDPQLNDCIKNNGNKVIPIITKGDPQLGIPSFSPFTPEVAPIFGNNLILILTDLYNDNIKDFKITSASLDLKQGKFALTGVFERGEVLASNYSIVRGKIIDIPASGHGKFNMTMIGVSMTYAGDIRLYKKGGEEYMELVNTTTKSGVEHAYYYFENLKSPEIDDVNGYLAKNWKRFREQLKASVNSYVTTFMHTIFDSLLQKVPFNKMFLP